MTYSAGRQFLRNLWDVPRNLRDSVGYGSACCEAQLVVLPIAHGASPVQAVVSRHGIGVNLNQKRSTPRQYVMHHGRGRLGGSLDEHGLGFFEST